MEPKEDFLLNGRISRVMTSYSLPCVISLLVGALYNIVDQVFIANASYLGSYGNAANTAVFPFTVVALAVAVMIGDGACADISIKSGEKNLVGARLSLANSIVMSAIAGMFFLAFYFVFFDSFLVMFGAGVNDQTFGLAQEYFRHIALGMPFYVFSQGANPVIRADGAPRFAMFSILAGAIINIILDPILIFAAHWGMAGVAIATVLGQVVSAGLSVWYFIKKAHLRPGKKDFRLSAGRIFRILSLGATSFLSQISLVAAMAAVNNMILIYGTRDAVFSAPELSQIPMAVVGIVMKFFQIVISAVVGMAAGCIPVVGFNMGAGNKKRVKTLFTSLLLCEVIVGAVAFIIVEVFPLQIMKIFGGNTESEYYVSFGLKSFRIYLCCIVLACVNKGIFIFLQSMGRVAESTILSMIREVGFGVGFAILLPLRFGLDGVLYSMPVSDFLTFVIGVFLIARTYRWLSMRPEPMPVSG